MLRLIFLSAILVLMSKTVAALRTRARYFGVSRQLSTSLFDTPPVRVNTLIDLSSPKVVNNIELKAGEKCVVCRCWKSSKFPLCDGSHVKHNTETGDNLGPAIISAAKIE